MKHVVVLGGGLAGLAAALRLSRQSHRVTILEASPKLGGRAYSFSHEASADGLDNGQHVLMGCYHDTLQFLGEVGTADLVQRKRGLALPFVRSDGVQALLQAGGLPHPLGLAQAFLGYRMLGFGARIRILKVALKLRALSESGVHELDASSAESWLLSLGQEAEAVEYFWRPVILATMNAEPSQASAKLLAVVLREIFLSDADASDMLVPNASLGSLFIDPAETLLRSRGVEVKMHAAAERLILENNCLTAVQLRDGTKIHADAFISAVPPWALQRVVAASGEPGMLPVDFDCFRPSEILSIHFWTARDLGAGTMTGLLDTTLQWLFFKGKESDGRWRYSATVSAAGADVPRTEDELRPLLLRELQLLCPDLQDADIVQLLPVREKRATFIPAPGLERERPPAATAIAGFYLAGDWTDTGFPATIEGAVRSGNAAADAVLAAD